MHVTISKSEFLHAVGRCAAVDSRVGTSAGFLLLDARDGALHLTATNNVLLCAETLSTTVKRPGQAAVPIKRLQALAAVMGGDTLSLEGGKGHTLRVGSGSQRKAQLAGRDPADFPRSAELDDKMRDCALPRGLLRRGLERVAHAVGDQERAFLDGVHLSVHDGAIDFVALCNSRIAWWSPPLETPLPCGDGKWFVPRYALGPTLAVCAGDPEASVRLRTDDRMLRVEDGGTRHVDAAQPVGDFPDWRAVLTSVPQRALGHINASLTADAVKAVLAAAEQGDATTKVAFGAKAHTLTVSVHDTHSGNQAEDVLPYEPEAGSEGDASTMVQGRFLRDALLAADGRVRCALGDLGDKAPPALLLTSADGYTSLVMPVTQ